MAGFNVNGTSPIYCGLVSYIQSELGPAFAIGNWLWTRGRWYSLRIRNFDLSAHAITFG